MYYEYINLWNKFNEKVLPSKQFFYSELNNSEINDNHCRHAERVHNRFEIYDLDKYQDLYDIIGVLLVTDVLENVTKYLILIL